MADNHDHDQEHNHDHEQDGGGTATLTRPETSPPKLDRMPQWKVILHNDDVNDMLIVVSTIVELTPLRRQEAFSRMMEAHQRGLTLLMCTHREHAELLEEQFMSKRMTVTIEPDR